MAQWNTGTDMITSYLGRATIFWRTASLLLLFLSGDGQLFVHRSANYKGTCRADTLSNVSYKEVGLVDRPSPGKVAYGVMVYQRQNKTVSDVFDQFTRLFDAIYSPNFTCVVHVDIKSEPALIEKITDYVKKHAPQASTIPSVSVSWGGITVVERTLALMQAALESDPEWEYFVNIGQEDYPLQSPAAIQEYLAHAVPPATNFIYCWDLRGHDFFGQWEHHEGRVSKVFVDMFDGRSREVRGLPRSPPKEYSFYKSLQQTVLSRAFVESAVHAPESRRLLLYLATSEAPDEIFFPTLLHLPSNRAHAARATCNSTLHFSHWIRPGGSWHPEYLTPLHLPLLLEKIRASSPSFPAFWARKFDVGKGSSALMAALDYLRECRPARDQAAKSLEWAPAIVFAKEMGQHIVDRELRDGEDPQCAYRVVRVGGKVVTGEDMLLHLDKARRSQDAEAIMRFLTHVENEMKAYKDYHTDPRWQVERRRLQHHRQVAERDLQPEPRILRTAGVQASEVIL